MLIYLASPYTHDERWGEAGRYHEVAKATSVMLQRGWTVFSPIVHSHPLATQYGCPQTWAFWGRHDRKYLEMCDELWVLALDGWKESRGVTEELKIAADMDKRIRVIDPWLLEQLTDLTQHEFVTGQDYETFINEWLRYHK
jgi:hypothetical protein